jgi:hypothetical protein
MESTEAETAARLAAAVGRLARRIRRTRAGAALTSAKATVLATTASNGPVGSPGLPARDLKEIRP